ncbi:hypothetical protein [Kribbella lupini]
MSTTTLEIALLVLIAVATLAVCFGGIVLAYRVEQDTSDKAARARRTTKEL